MNINGILAAALSLGALGFLFAVLLGYASKKFEVKVNPKISLIKDVLPGANCGGCGFAGCDAFATAVVEEGANPAGCSVGGPKVSGEIGAILGVEVVQGDKKVAFVKCNGTCDKAKDKYEYTGIKDCRNAAAAIGEGQKACSYGCLGYGTCITACEFGAITVENGVAVINEEKCTSCGACTKICPKNLIEIIPMNKRVRVSCNSKDFGKSVKDNCSVGCIGCSLCSRNCPENAIIMDGKLARVDYDKCIECKACIEKCPTKAINIR